MASANPKIPWHWDATPLQRFTALLSTPLQSSELATHVFNVFSTTFQKLQVFSDSTSVKLLSYLYHHPVVQQTP